jgi:asparagine synthase (glutamine-hydrolysing)
MIGAIVANRTAEAGALHGLFPAHATAFTPNITVDVGTGLSWASALPPGQESSGLVSGYRDPRTGRAAFIHGRLFNLADLAAAIRLNGHAPAQAVLELYGSEDPDWPQRLHGQFVIVIWDPALRKVTAVRDRLGIVPLYYRRIGDGIAFASAAKQLLNAGPKSGPDRGMIATYLVDDVLRSSAFSTERTFFADVKRVIAGNCLTFSGDTVDQKPYWDIALPFRAPKTANPDPAKYLQLFEHVVREQAGDYNGVGSALSGGLDSPAILMMLAKPDPRRAIPTVSLGELGEGVSESANIKAVLAGVNTVQTWVRPDDYDMFGVISDSHWHQECPTFSPSPAVFYLLKRAAAENGVTTLFSGLGADELLGGLNLGYLADLFWQGRWLRFAHELRAYQKVDSLRLSLSAAALFRDQVFDPMRWFRRRRPIPQWIRRDLVEEFRLDERHWDWPARPGLSQFDGRVCTLLTNTFTPSFLHYETHNALAWGIENRFPYIDNRVVDYAAHLPWHERSAEGIYKIHHREALKTLVPPQVWKQTKKTLIPTVHDHWMREAYRPQVEAIINGGGQWTEYLDAATVRREHALYQTTDDFSVRNRLRRSTWRAVSLGIWLNRFWG